MPLETPSFTASGNIYPSRFVDLSGRHTVAQAAVGSTPFGISQEGTETAPISGASSYAASSGGSLRVYGPMESCQLEAGEALSVGAKLKPDANGKGVAIKGGEAYFAIALKAAAASGEKISVFILPNMQPRPATTLASAGSTQGNSAALTANTIYSVSGADGTKGVTLPTPVGGELVEVYNLHASNGLKIWPHSGGDINDGTADAAITIEGKTLAILRALDSSTWAAIYTVNT